MSIIRVIAHAEWEYDTEEGPVTTVEQAREDLLDQLGFPNENTFDITVEVYDA